MYLIGMNFVEFLTLLFAEEEQYEHDEETVAFVRREMRIPVVEDAGSYQKAVLRRRLASGAVPTLDGIGVALPRESVDTAYLESVPWIEAADEGILEAAYTALGRALAARKIRIQTRRAVENAR